MARPDSDLAVIDHDPGHQRETAEVVAHYVPPSERKRELRELRMRRWMEPWLYAGLFWLGVAAVALIVIIVKGGLA